MLGFHSISEYPISDKAVPNLAGSFWYSYGGVTSLPTNDADAPNVFAAADYTSVAAVNSVYQLGLSTLTYNILVIKQAGATNTAGIALTWTGKSSRAGSVATIKLQIYNYNTAAWVDLATNSTVAANTDFTLSATQSTSLSNFYAGGNLVTARIIQ